MQEIVWRMCRKESYMDSGKTVGLVGVGPVGIGLVGTA